MGLKQVDRAESLKEGKCHDLKVNGAGHLVRTVLIRAATALVIVRFTDRIRTFSQKSWRRDMHHIAQYSWLEGPSGIEIGQENSP